MMESDEESGGGTRTRSKVGMFCSGWHWVVVLGPVAQRVFWLALLGPQPSSLMPRGGNDDLIHLN